MPTFRGGVCGEGKRKYGSNFRIIPLWNFMRIARLAGRSVNVTLRSLFYANKFTFLQPFLHRPLVLYTVLYDTCITDCMTEIFPLRLLAALKDRVLNFSFFLLRLGRSRRLFQHREALSGAGFSIWPTDRFLSLSLSFFTLPFLLLCWVWVGAGFFVIRLVQTAGNRF